MIACRLLGPAEITIDGRPAPAELLWRKHLALLVYLVLSPKRARTREHLIGLLWGDKEESAARHSLREAVRILRQSLSSTAVETAGQQIRLVVHAVDLDTAQFEQLVAGERWEQAAALVAGEFLEGFSVPDASAFEDWLTAQRFEWRRRTAEALRHHADRCLDAGRVREAVGAARRAVVLEPVSDLAVQSLMRGEALAGDRAAALEAYSAFAERVRAEAGSDPSSTTTDLAERIRRARGPTQPTPAPPPGVPWTRRAPLVGRAQTLAQLTGLWDATVAGGGAALAILEGDLGMGRTRLLEELELRVALDGGAVGAALAVPADLDEPWSGVVGLARGGLAEAPGVAATRREALAAFATRIPAWSDRFPRARDADAAPLGNAFREVVAAAAEERPVLLLADDAQWFDADSLRALQATLRDLAHARVMLVLTVLPGFREPVLDELRAALDQTWRGAALSLERLGSADIGRLAAWALPSYTANELERVTRRVALDSAGIPLLVVELLHAIALGLEPGEAGGAWPAPFRTLSQTLPSDLPAAVVGAVRVGFRALTRTAQTTLAALSVLPDRATEDLAARASGLSAEQLHAALDELEWHRWLAVDARGYTFVARIIKDIIAQDMLTPGQKRRILSAAGMNPA